jgi:phosphatidate cytidylyltransferase
MTNEPTPPVAPSPSPTPSKGKVFLRRLASSLALWTVVLGALFCGNKLVSDVVFILIMLLLAACGMFEFYGLVRARGLVCFRKFGMAAGLLMVAGTFLHCAGKLGIHDSPARVNDFETIFLILFVLGLCIRQFIAKDNPHGIVAMATTLLGLMYVPWLLNFIQKIEFFRFPTGAAADAGRSMSSTSSSSPSSATWGRIARGRSSANTR